MMVPYDSVQELRTYAILNKIPPCKTTEETVNLILENLIRDPRNKDSDKYRSELLSSTAVVLMGLGKITDPVRLYRNLTEAFERRGSCIFTNTVERAIKRLQSDAISQGKEAEIMLIWRGLKSRYTKWVLSDNLSMSSLEEILKNSDVPKDITFKTMWSKEEFPKEELFRMIWKYNDNALLYAPARISFATALRKRKDITTNELLNLLTHNIFRKDAAFALLQRPLTQIELQQLLTVGDLEVMIVIAQFISKGRLPFEKIKGLKTPEDKIEMIKSKLERITMIPKYKNRVSDLAHISGSRGKRRKAMNRMTKPLRA